MRRLTELFGQLPAAARAAVVVLAAGLVGVAAWGGVSSYLRKQAVKAELALATAAAGYRQAISSGDETALAATAESLRRLLAESPPAGVARQAWYLLGNVEYRRRAYDPALAAFEESAELDPSSFASRDAAMAETANLIDANAVTTGDLATVASTTGEFGVGLIAPPAAATTQDLLPPTGVTTTVTLAWFLAAVMLAAPCMAVPGPCCPAKSP